VLPLPKLLLEGEAALQYDEQEWEQGWQEQARDSVYRVRMALTGHPG
jgi:hypothetical protein